MLLADVVAASHAASATRSRLAKTAAVADALDGRLPVAEHPVDRAEAPAGLDLRLHPSLG